MKKLLSILGAIGLTTTSTTSLIACKTPKSDNNNENGGGNKPEPTPEPQKPPIGSNWKLINDYYSEFSDLSLEKININNMWYIALVKKDDNTYYFKKFKNDNKNITGNHWNNGIAINHEWFSVPTLYKWELKTEPIELPQIDKNTGKITDWKG